MQQDQRKTEMTGREQDPPLATETENNTHKIKTLVHW